MLDIKAVKINITLISRFINKLQNIVLIQKIMQSLYHNVYQKVYTFFAESVA